MPSFPDLFMRWIKGMFTSGNKRSHVLLLMAGTVLIAAVCPARGWHGPGHERATLRAAGMLPADTPAFFVEGADTIAHCAKDPDLFRKPLAGEQAHAAEAPQHYFDRELLDGTPISPTREDFIQGCAAKGIKPSAIGFVPYATAEWTQRLTVALAEHRKWPNNPHIQHKCLVYAGLLSHYAQDLCQPLHTTIHYNGRANPDGTSPRSGIHVKVDALLQKLEPAELPAGTAEATAFDDLMSGVLEELRKSHRLVDRVYELEGLLPALDAPLPSDPDVRQFVAERLNSAALFTARLYATAWRDSADVELPAWHRRAAGTPALPAQRDSEQPDASWRLWAAGAAGFVLGTLLVGLLLRRRKHGEAGESDSA